jgi:Raf kinase inhibitor-like YbhB/YbcL family protein
MATITRGIEKSVTIESNDVRWGKEFPDKFTCSGDDVSPHLRFSNLPDGTQAFAFILDDPDAPGASPWVHWTFWDLPSNVDELVQGVDVAKFGAKQGATGWPDRRPAYYGPCPPPRKPHTYRLRVFALDGPVGLEEGASVDELEKAMEGHVLGWGETSATYRRR